MDKNNPWWNPYLSKQRRKLDTLYKHQKANKGFCAKEKYKAFRKEYKKDVEEARKASWDDYKEKIDSVEEMNKFRKIIERHLNIQMGTLEKLDGSITAPGIDTIQHLADTHFGQSSGLKQTSYTKNIIMRQEVEDWNPDWMTVGKIAVAIHQFKNKKSPGPDGLRPIVLKNLPKNCLEHYSLSIKHVSFSPLPLQGGRGAGLCLYPNPAKAITKQQSHGDRYH